MSRVLAKLSQASRGNKLLLLVFLLLSITIALLMSHTGDTRGISQTMESQKSPPPSRLNQKERKKQPNSQTDGDEDKAGDISLDADKYDDDSPGLFGFLKSAANREWFNPFQSTAFRDPPPASWDSGFSDETIDEEDDTFYTEENISEESEPDEQIEINEIESEDENEKDFDGEEQYPDKKDNVVGTDNVAKSKQEAQKPRKPFKSPAPSKEDTKKTAEIENRKSPVKSNEKPAGAQNAKQTEKNRIKQIPERDLFNIFQDKLSKVSVKSKKLADACSSKRTIANSCDEGKCRQMKLPAAPEERVKQLIHHPGLKLSALQHALLQEMAGQVQKTYDVILLTTASSNHFLESQALLQNLHKNVFPVLRNFTLLFYDIGLTKDERDQMEKYCRCQVLSFPFDKLPNYVSNLKCYAWKPLMIKAHIRQANVVLWLDASIRFNGNPSQLQELVHRVKERGVQIGSSSSDTTFRSFRSLYHFFGDEPCMYLGMGQAKATIGGYHNEPFVERVILEPWVACALHQECMCPRNKLSAGCAESKKMAENYFRKKGPIIYGLCHRFDQSAITLILHKLYQANYPWVMMNVHDYGDIHRDHQVEYFKGLR